MGVCICGHEAHAWEDPTVCSNLNCKCEKFIEATPANPVPPNWIDYVNEMNTTKAKIAWLLDNIKYLRNYPNTPFIDWFRKNVKNTEVGTIGRTKRKLVEENPARFGPFDAPELEMQKQLKQVGIEEWVVSQ